MNQLNGFYYMFLPHQSFDDGSLRLGVVCKRTYRLAGGEAASADEAQLPLFTADVHWDKAHPLLSSVKHEADPVPCKPKTDVVVNARAHAPGGRPVDQMTAAVEVEGVTKKTILVIGDRYCIHRPGTDPAFSSPRPFEQIAVRYEHAYGGIDSEAGKDGGLAYPKNTVGVGFALAGTFSSPTVDRMPLPNLEDPSDRLTPERVRVLPERLRDAPQPAGFGWYGKGWIPRVDKAGLPRAWRALYEKTQDLERARAQGAVFNDFDLEYFNGASPGLIVPFLRGDEWLRLTGLDPSGTYRFRLPGESVHVALDVGEGLREVAMNLTTVAVLREEERLYQVWSGAIPYRSNEELFEKGFEQMIIEPTTVPARRAGTLLAI